MASSATLSNSACIQRAGAWTILGQGEAHLPRTVAQAAPPSQRSAPIWSLRLVACSLGGAQGPSGVTQDVGTQRLRESYAEVKGQTCFQSPYQEQPSEGKWAALEVRLGAMAGAGPGPGDLRGDPMGGGEREREDQGGREEPTTNTLPMGGAARTADHPRLPGAEGLPVIQGFQVQDWMDGHPRSGPG